MWDFMVLVSDHCLTLPIGLCVGMYVEGWVSGCTVEMIYQYIIMRFVIPVLIRTRLLCNKMHIPSHYSG